MTDIAAWKLVRAESKGRNAAGLLPNPDCRGLFEFTPEDVDEAFENLVVEGTAFADVD